MTESELLKILKDWNVMQNDIIRLREKLNELDYRITPSYSLTGGVSGGLFSSKVENLSIRREKISRKLDRIILKIKMCNDSCLNCGLDDTEKEVIKTIRQQKSLKGLAIDLEITTPKVYRIRNKALEKMCIYITEMSK